MSFRQGRLAGLVAIALAAGAAPVAHAFDAAREADNYSKIGERFQHVYGLDPTYQENLAAFSTQNELEYWRILATDGPTRTYGRDFTGNLCAHHGNGCAGDIRYYGWGDTPGATVKPVLFTARNGSTLSGHVWTSDACAKSCPGIVVTNGSVQAPEELYWYMAADLARAGYIVMTWDPQGQGFSDTYGDGADRFDGVPSQTGEPFYDGTEDALDFFFSKPSSPYLPRPSCSTGTSHADKQRARVLDGRDSAYNPLYARLDAGRVGIAGHSLGAAAVSYIGQIDARVKAIVAWDNLRAPGPAPFACPSGSSKRPDAPSAKPALGMSADYGLTPTPYTTDPDRTAKDAAARQLAAAGVPTGELVIRGGTHYEFSFIPNPGFGATLRGEDLVPGTRPRGSTALSKATGRRRAACSPIAGARTRPRRPSTPRVTATSSPSTTTRPCGPTAARARTCAPLRAAGWRRTGRATSLPWAPPARGDAGGGRTPPMSRRCSSRS